MRLVYAAPSLLCRSQLYCLPRSSPSRLSPKHSRHGTGAFHDSQLSLKLKHTQTATSVPLSLPVSYPCRPAAHLLERQGETALDTQALLPCTPAPALHCAALLVDTGTTGPVLLQTHQAQTGSLLCTLVPIQYSYTLFLSWMPGDARLFPYRSQ